MKIEDFAPRTHVVNKEHHNWVSTSEIAEKLAVEYSRLRFPWLEKEHIHGVASVVTGLCNEHHQIVPMHVGNLWRGVTKYGCPACAQQYGGAFEGFEDFNIKRNRPNYIGQSKAEFNLFCAIKEVFPDTLAHHKMPGRKEIDIWIPSIRAGIEYNGSYYHSNKCGKDENYHIQKSRLANRDSKQIFHLFPEEAVDVDRIVRMLNLFGGMQADGHNEWKLKPKSTLTVREVIGKVGDDFHNKWNFVNFKDSLIHLNVGLFDEQNELVALLGLNLKEFLVVKVSYAKLVVDIGRIVKALNKMYGAPFAVLCDLRNPVGVLATEVSVQTGQLVVCAGLAPTTYPLDKAYGFIPRNFAMLVNLIDPLKKPVTDEVARTWDCGNSVYAVKNSVPYWTKRLDV